MTTSSIEHLPTAWYRSSDDGQSSAAVLDATLAELNDRGYAAASLRTIAQRAGVPLETVFERWGSKQHLVQDAVGHLARRQPTPETGDLRSDLIQVAEALGELLAYPGVVDVLRSLLTPAGAGAAAGGPPRVNLLSERRAIIRRIVARGQRREQCAAHIHPGLVADAILGGLVYRLLISGEAVTRKTVAGLIDLVLADHA